uniref:ATP-dependent (S)-NAD(P)H-hydrate dehydratase n=1 Tax=Panagrolaimus sp. ES5 TaxID=591445 RepID=A0AC34FFR4_9BILA
MTFDEAVGEYFPDLNDSSVTKGSSGRLATIGGSAEYTGAPYYAAYAPLRIGADLSYLYTHPDAAVVLKSYSPDLIVHPGLEWDIIKKRMDYFDGITFGPGLGRDTDTLLPLLKDILKEVKECQDNLSMVIDADGLFIAEQDISALRGCHNVILTPNHREFEHLWEAAFPSTKLGENIKECVQKVAKELGIVVMRKGKSDIISDGDRVIECSDKSSPRRCGGQGDLITGATAIFAHWAKMKFPDAKCPKTRLLRGAYAASRFIRYTGFSTYRTHGRSMTASDMIGNIGNAVRHFERPSNQV